MASLIIYLVVGIGNYYDDLSHDYIYFMFGIIAFLPLLQTRSNGGGVPQYLFYFRFFTLLLALAPALSNKWLVSFVTLPQLLGTDDYNISKSVYVDFSCIIQLSSSFFSSRMTFVVYRSDIIIESLLAFSRFQCYI